MLAGHSHKLLAEAAKESIERIQLDRRKVPPRLKPLLAYIEENLFDPTLDVNQLKRSCGVRDNSVPIQFHSAVGRPPHGYIEDRRLETACRLLAEANLKIWQISELLGYSSIQVFSRAFSRWSGQRPTLFRKKARRGGDDGDDPPRKPHAGRRRFDHSLIATESLRKALDGELPAEEAKTLIDRLISLYPAYRESLDDSSPEPADDSTDPDPDPEGVFAPKLSGEPRPDVEAAQLKGNARDRFLAETVWDTLEGQERDRQEEIVCETTVTSTAMFDLLIEKSREIGPGDPHRGVHFAELALASLEALVRRSGDDKQFAGLQAKGWANLASARNQAADLAGAEQGFKEATGLLEAAGQPPARMAETLACKASLRRDQLRFPEARELLERARASCPKDDADLATRILLIQASVQLEEGDPPSSAIPLLEQALPQARKSKDISLRLAIYHNLIATYSEAGLFHEAVKLLPMAKDLSSRQGTGFNRIRNSWLEGLVARGLGELDKAEDALQDARDAYCDLGDGFNTALVCLDLADLLSRQNRNADLIALCGSMAPLSGMLQHHGEAIVALQIFQRAAEEQSVTSMVVEEARRALLRSRKQLDS